MPWVVYSNHSVSRWCVIELWVMRHFVIDYYRSMMMIVRRWKFFDVAGGMVSSIVVGGYNKIMSPCVLSFLPQIRVRVMIWMP